MASSSERRKGFWDENKEEDETVTTTKTGKVENTAPVGAAPETISQKVQEASVLLEQTHQLYQQFFNGVEKRTPVEKLKLLETKLAELKQFSSQSTSARFQIQQFIQQVNSMKDLWDRKLRARE